MNVIWSNVCINWSRVPCANVRFAITDHYITDNPGCCSGLGSGILVLIIIGTGSSSLEDNEILRVVRRKARLRLSYALIALAFYFAFLLNYLPAGDFLRERLGSSWISGSLAMFAGLIVLFIVLEMLFLFVDSDDDPEVDGR